jgi:hypothetical protein
MSRRYPLAITAAELVPVPLLDTWIQNRLRIRWTRAHAEAHGWHLDDDAVRALAVEPYTPLRRVALWPVKAVAKKLLWFAAPVFLWRTWHSAVAYGEQLKSAA